MYFIIIISYIFKLLIFNTTGYDLFKYKSIVAVKISNQFICSGFIFSEHSVLVSFACLNFYKVKNIKLIIVLTGITNPNLKDVHIENWPKILTYEVYKIHLPGNSYKKIVFVNYVGYDYRIMILRRKIVFGRHVDIGFLSSEKKPLKSPQLFSKVNVKLINKKLIKLQLVNATRFHKN